MHNPAIPAEAASCRLPAPTRRSPTIQNLEHGLVAAHYEACRYALCLNVGRIYVERMAQKSNYPVAGLGSHQVGTRIGASSFCGSAEHFIHPCHPHGLLFIVLEI